ncbi:hypothetical protein AWB64_03688 [Caballeronia sordidicola]|uniref:Uncharacterized protein n=1 Tax=Caballeronia sordidicola TaxID=196367 RepID=A0A158GY86_CABSO|nr:hypothetical protein AWB64_03688 [Caballeronia sordidicola]
MNGVEGLTEVTVPQIEKPLQFALARFFFVKNVQLDVVSTSDEPSAPIHIGIVH